ncbi:hypothetical protein SAMN04487858_112197, partial [Pseudomonas sp. ok602]|uniref:SEL1-like repeat protein n=1 Tax=Pseudomonas sp. ok602 TaxID=1761898 RepID=UPI0008ECC3D8
KAAPDPLAHIKADLAFTCVHEKIPDASADADVLFQYARWLQKNNQLKQDKSVDVEVERLYRIASENDHYKANINLQNGAMRGHFNLRGEEHLRMSQQLIDAGVATGYYLVGVFLKQGGAGLKQDSEMSRRYYRKAADEGSAQAQYLISNLLAPIDMAPDIARQMRRCAAEQGHGEAAVTLGVNLSTNERYQEAAEAYQLGVVAGDSISASFLSKGFRGPASDDLMYYLAQKEDLERADRYKTISKVLGNYSYANPKVPEINDILPLPPAPLPAWDGKLQWLEERLANIPPQKPTEALIQQLAKAKTLDPKTGRPMPGAAGFIRATSGMGAPNCFTGQACPKSGYWRAVSPYNRDQNLEHTTILRFEQGQVMPTARVRTFQLRFLLPDIKRVDELGVEWSYLGEA